MRSVKFLSVIPCVLAMACGGAAQGPVDSSAPSTASETPAMDDSMAESDSDTPAATAEAPGTVVDVAVGAGSFNTLVAAVKAAGLVETLSGDGPFTVFAPTDEAFAKLPAGTVEDLLKPENKEKLVAILTYHVVSGKVMAADVAKLDTAKTVQGSNVSIQVSGGGVRLNDSSSVVKADIPASNGVIHVIDTVIMPKS